MMHLFYKELESVIEEEASELETPASELNNKENKLKGLHRKQTSVFSSKRGSGLCAPLEESIEDPVEKDRCEPQAKNILQEIKTEEKQSGEGNQIPNGIS